MRNERLLDSKETATVLGCTQAALALWRRQRRGPTYVRLGLRMVRYRERDLARWLEAGRVEPGPGTQKRRSSRNAWNRVLGQWGAVRTKAG